MLGSEYNWLAQPLRTARHGLLTLTLGLGCLGFLALPTTASVAHLASVTATAPAALDRNTPTDWPRTFLRLWLLLPHLVPNDN